jgi:hypothetical protein
MGRQVVTESDVQRAKRRAAQAGGVAGGRTEIPNVDKYTDRLIKYIPAEVIAVYLAVENIFLTSGDESDVAGLSWVVFVILLVLTPLYLWRVQGVNRWQQLAISAVSFGVWVFSLGGPFVYVAWYKPLYASVLLPIYVFGAAIWEAES